MPYGPSLFNGYYPAPRTMAVLLGFHPSECLGPRLVASVVWGAVRAMGVGAGLLAARSQAVE